MTTTRIFVKVDDAQSHARIFRADLSQPLSDVMRDIADKFNCAPLTTMSLIDEFGSCRVITDSKDIKKHSIVLVETMVSFRTGTEATAPATVEVKREAPAAAAPATPTTAAPAPALATPTTAAVVTPQKQPPASARRAAAVGDSKTLLRVKVDDVDAAAADCWVDLAQDRDDVLEEIAYALGCGELWRISLVTSSGSSFTCQAITTDKLDIKKGSTVLVDTMASFGTKTEATSAPANAVVKQESATAAAAPPHAAAAANAAVKQESATAAALPPPPAAATTAAAAAGDSSLPSTPPSNAAQNNNNNGGEDGKSPLQVYPTGTKVRAYFEGGSAGWYNGTIIGYQYVVKYEDDEEIAYDVDDVGFPDMVNKAEAAAVNEDNEETESEHESLLPQDANKKPAATSQGAASASVAAAAAADDIIDIDDDSSFESATEPPKKKRRKQRKKTPALAPTQRSMLQDARIEIDLDELETYLLEVEDMSDANTRSVMRQVSRLIDGVGITYRHWPKQVVFCQRPVCYLHENFAALRRQGQDYEDQYGEDLGHGWLVRHPLQKLSNFQHWYFHNRFQKDGSD